MYSFVGIISHIYVSSRISGVSKETYMCEIIPTNTYTSLLTHIRFFSHMNISFDTRIYSV